MSEHETLWVPAADAWQSSQIGQFAASVGIASYDELVEWSVDDLDTFWSTATDWLGMRWSVRPTAALDDAPMPGTTWFPGGRLNYAEHVLAIADADPDRVALDAYSQSRDRVQVTYAELASQVRQCAAALGALGVREGDRVAAFAPDIPETIVAFLATASIGAVWASCAPEFGVRAVTDRLSQLEPTVVFAVDGYQYGRRVVDRRDHLDEIVAALPSLRHVVAIPYVDHGQQRDPGFDVPVVSWPDLLTAGAAAGVDLAPVPVPAAHPLYVLFSSGTTGLPKAIVHGHGGIVAEHLKVLRLHHDLQADDVFFWFTTTGWMMWNYKVSGLLIGATVVLFDGDPAWPHLDTLWNTVAESGTTVFGTSASFVMACRRKELTLPAVPALRLVGSTGSPLPPEGFQYIVDTFGVPVSSICGGTDVCTAFIGSSTVQPLVAGRLGGRFLGCAVEAHDEDGRRCAPGETGELVITKPLPSMPVAFWGDEDGSRYRSAYFAHGDPAWHHGDWVTFHDDGSCVVTGRSDATLNRGGVRLGTSEFYSVVEAIEPVTDSLVVHLEGPDAAEGGLGKLILFVELAGEAELTDDFRVVLRSALTRELSPRHGPDVIEQVPVIPRTLSGKKLELPVKRILSGAQPDSVVSRDSLSDPTALDWFVANASRW